MQLSVGAVHHFGRTRIPLKDGVSCGVVLRPLATAEEENSSILAESELAWLYPQAGHCLIASLDEHGVMPISKTPQIHFDRSTLQASSDLEESSGHHVAVSHSTKKKRLSDVQVKFLERNFNLDSKLEPERKNQLAHELGLQPRQVAIWYQNKRARSKTKQLEQKYDALKEEYEDVLAEKMSLETEVTRLREVLGLQNNKLKQPGAKIAASVEKGGAAEASRISDDQPWSKDGVAGAFEEWRPESFNDAVTAAKLQDEEGKLETLEADTPAETDVDSIELSCGTGQSEALDASSPASSDNQQKTPTLTELRPYDFTVDHRQLCNQQYQLQHSFMYPEHGTVKIENGESVFLNTPILHDLDHYYSTHLFSLEDVNHLPLF